MTFFSRLASKKSELEHQQALPSKTVFEGTRK